MAKLFPVLLMRSQSLPRRRLRGYKSVWHTMEDTHPVEEREGLPLGRRGYQWGMGLDFRKIKIHGDNTRLVYSLKLDSG